MEDLGEFKNRIKDLLLNEEPDEKWLIGMVDQAKKEFPKNNSGEILRWFEKWFGKS